MDEIDAIEDALLFLEQRREGRMRDEQWTGAEMKDLKKACYAQDSPALGPDLHRAMVAERNNWSYKSGAIDSCTVENYQREYEEHLKQ
tara:strand:+ start:231 stop:494 length:264 start_codon:yes stop_codon:yes gene_type:complete